MKAILSIQSEVAYGHVGNSAATLPLQRLGFEVWPVDTVQLGHHPGYGRFRGYRVEAERFEAVLDAVLDQAPLINCVGMIGGYLGDASLAEPILRARQAVSEQQPNLVFLLDPVIGDDGTGVFVHPDVPGAIADHLLPHADIVTPNRFELEYFSGTSVVDLDGAIRAAERLAERGPRIVVATGLPDPDHPDQLAMLVVSTDLRWLIHTPRLARGFSGTGDAFSALLLGHHLLAPDLKTAFEYAASAIFSTVELTAKQGEDELALVAVQDVLGDAVVRFPAVPI